MNYLFRPITTWPGQFTSGRRRSPFKASYNDTLKLLDRELRHLGANADRAGPVVIQLALSEREIRNDGRPYANARPAHPGIVVSFVSRHGPLSFPCDTFDAWESNLRAIALALEHLRTVDRYGVTKRGEQYTGWGALPAPAASMTPQAAKTLLEGYSGPAFRIRDKATLGDAYRNAVLATHPDRGGDAEKFKLVQQAKEILEPLAPK